MSDEQRDKGLEERYGRTGPAEADRSQARDEEPEVEGHKLYVGPEKTADPSGVRKAG